MAESWRCGQGEIYWGVQIGRYEVLEEIARGGMGVVYKAHDPATRRLVAIKLMLGSRALDERAMERVRREAEALARLNEPGVIGIHELGEHAGSPFLVLDYVSAVSLQEYLDRDGPLGAPEAVEIVSEVARAVQSAHDAGVLHRDLKPSNVLLTPRGQPILIDFGLANDWLSSSRSRLTQTGHMLGTPGYWAPEQVRGDSEQAPTTDVYGLAGVLYALLTGHVPHEGESLIEILAKIDRPVPAASSWNPDVSRQLDAVLSRALAPDPRRRYPSAAAFAEALAAPPQRGWPFRLAAVGVVAAGVLGLVLLGVSTDRGAELPESSSVELTPGEPSLLEPYERYLRLGHAHLANRSFGRALASYTQAIASDRDDPRAYDARAEAHRRLGQLQKSIDDRTRVIELQPSRRLSGDARLSLDELGEALVLLKKTRAKWFGGREPVAALATCDSLVALLPDVGVAHALRAQVLSLHYAPAALVSFDRAIALDPGGRGRYFLGRGEAFGRLSDPEGATAEYSHSIFFQPTAEAFRLRAQARALLGDVEGAAADYRWAGSLSFEHGSAVLAQLKSLDRKEQAPLRQISSVEELLARAEARGKSESGEAFRDLTWAIQLAPQRADLYAARAASRPNGLGRLATRGAARDCERALALDPDCAEAYAARGRLRHRDGPGALADFERWVQLRPDDPEAYAARATARVACGATQEALRDLNRVIAMRPGDAAGYAARADQRGRMADYSGAIADYTRVSQLRELRGLEARQLARATEVRELERGDGPQDAAGWIELGAAKGGLGNQRGAIAAYNRAIAAAPGDLYAQTNRALARTTLGEFETALEELDAILTRDPNFAFARGVRGMALARLGRHREALADFDRAIALDPQASFVKQVKQERSTCAGDLIRAAE